MKKIILIACTICTIFTTLNAQELGNKMHKQQGKSHENGFKKIVISDEQKAKVKSIREEYQKKMADLKKNDGITVKEWKEKKALLEKENRNKMQSILTVDQKNQLEKMKLEKREFAVINQNAKMEKMKIHLGLSNEQSNRIKEEQKMMIGKMKSIKENPTLSNEQKKAEVKLMMKKRKEFMASVLTPDQMKELHKKKRPHQKQSHQTK